MKLPESLHQLIRLLSRLPGVGEKSAARYCLFLLAQKRIMQDLARALTEVASSVGFCDTCFNLTDSPRCSICLDPMRDQTVLCVVESVPDLWAIERTGEYHGLYHVLQGAISPLSGVGPEDLRIAELEHRLGKGEVAEVILATNVSVDGEATALYIRRLLEPLGTRISRIATGVPIGGDLEFIDPVTLSRALSGRKPFGS